MIRLVFLLTLFLTFFPAPLTAKEIPFSHAIAMHDAPKYGPGFKHFDYVNPNAPKSGTLRIGVSGTFDSLNPFTIKGTPAYGLPFASASNPVFLSLMARSWDEPFTLYGLIAQGVRTPPDRSWVEFKLNPNARWSDGKLLTAEDVLFSWETLRTKGRPNHRNYYNRVAAAEVTSPGTVRFTFKPPAQGQEIDREMPLIMGLMPILPKHWWKDRPADSTFLDPPPGSGAYRIIRVEPGRAITFARIKDWWAKDLPAMVGQHNPDILRADYYRDDTVALEAFKAYAYDLRRETDLMRWKAGYDSPALREGQIILDALAHGRPERLRGFVYNTRRPFFQDSRVREALSYAFDFSWINHTLFGSAYKRIKSYYPNSLLASSGVPSAAEKALLNPYKSVLPKQLFTTPFETAPAKKSLRENLRHARDLLSQAGWGLKDSRLLNNAEQPFEFEILLNDPTDERIALEFARTLRRLGVTASVRTVDSAQHQARLADFDFDMMVTTNQWMNSLSPGVEQLTYYGSTFADTPGSRNYPGIKNPGVDALAQRIVKTKTRADLITTVHALDRVLLWGHYIIPLYYSGYDYVAHWASVKRPAVTPVYGAILETWWVDEKAPAKRK